MPISGLTDKGIAIGCVGSARATFHGEKSSGAQRRARLRQFGVADAEGSRKARPLAQQGRPAPHRVRAAVVSERSRSPISRGSGRASASSAPKIAEQIEIDAKYEVYLSRQAADVAAYRRDESFALPDDLDYAALPGLSNEVKQKLIAQRPRTIGHAGKIDGVTPAALTLLVAHVRRGAGKPAKTA